MLDTMTHSHWLLFRVSRAMNDHVRPLRLPFQIVVIAAVVFPTVPLTAATPVEAPRVPQAGRTITVNAMRDAIAKALPLIETSSAEYLRQRECFSCHHQAMATLTLVEARDRGFSIDEQNLASQIERTKTHLERGKQAYREGRGQGGQVDTAGWALWTLEAAEVPPDDTTGAVAHYLLNWQNDLGHWKPSGRGRRPTQGSDFTATYVALRGLNTFSNADQAEQIAERQEKVKQWLLATPPTDNEDRVFRLRSLYYLAVDDDVIDAAAKDLLAEQRSDGGWAQTKEEASDAYATGTALVALSETGILTTDSPIYQRGVAFLLEHQGADGSWRVETRAKPIQVYFESGFPHSKDQFISMAATCWATLALLHACPEEPSPAVREAASRP